jgi:hypothetical protein
LLKFLTWIAAINDSIHTFFRNPVAYITKATTEIPIIPAPVIASFSSRGPSTILPSILKVCYLLFSSSSVLLCLPLVSISTISFAM